MAWALRNRDLRSWDPFAGLLEDFWNGSSLSGSLGRNVGTFPALNVWLGADDAIITAELPGVDPGDLQVQVEGESLKLAGRRKAHEPAEGERFHRRERGAGEFSRVLTLPFRVDAAGVDATHERGVLRVRVPRAPEDRPRRIEVKSA
jgi:HSP20 family protein